MSKDEPLETIAEILETIAGIDRSTVTADRTFAEFDLDSLATLEVIVASEDRFGVLIQDEVWPRFATVGDLVGHIERATASVPSPRA